MPVVGYADTCGSLHGDVFILPLSTAAITETIPFGLAAAEVGEQSDVCSGGGCDEHSSYWSVDGSIVTVESSGTDEALLWWLLLMLSVILTKIG